jgi:cell division protein FtsL
MDTTDNTIVKLRLATFITLLVAVISLSVTIAGIIGKISGMEVEIQRLDERITKTTSRNAEAIKELKK